MKNGETISSADISLDGKSATALWSMSFAVVSVAMASTLYAAAHLPPASEDLGGGIPVIMVDFGLAPQASETGEQVQAIANVEPSPIPDDEAAQGADEPIPPNDTDTETEAAVAGQIDPELVPVEDEAPALPDEPDEPPTASQGEIASDPVDMPSDPAEIETTEVEAELTLPQLAAIPDDIAQLRAQTPATSHAPPPQQQAAAPRSTAAVQPSAQQIAPQPAAPPTPQAPPAPQISPQRWQGQLFAHLDRFKRYPSAASQRREQGTIYVQFSIDSAGNILTSRIVRSSGYANLDEAAAQMMRTASPVPRPPAELGSPVTLTVPIEFSLR